jgi:glutamine amidotransferase
LQSDLDQLRARGVFNMLMTDSTRLYAYCTTKLYRLTRRAPFGEAHLCDAELRVDFQEVTTDNDVVTVIATAPLTDNESWTAFEPGELCVVESGEATCLPPAPQ